MGSSFSCILTCFLYGRLGVSYMLGAVGSFFVLNPLHGIVTDQFKAWGLPALFVPAVGLYELTVSYLHLYGGENKWVAPKLLAALMGGAVYSHAVAEGKPEAIVGALAFLGFSCVVSLLNNSPLVSAAW